MEMDVWYDVLVRELAEVERLNDLLAQAEEDAQHGAPAPDEEVEAAS